MLSVSTTESENIGTSRSHAHQCDGCQPPEVHECRCRAINLALAEFEHRGMQHECTISGHRFWLLVLLVLCISGYLKVHQPSLEPVTEPTSESARQI